MLESQKIKIITIEKDMASVMAQNSKENISAILKRLNVFVDDSWDKDVLSLILRDTILENPEYVLYIHGKEILTFVIRLWESEELDLSPADWALLGQLRLLGFIEYSNEQINSDKENCIKVVKEAKEHLYFYLKSKTSRHLMNKLENWESVIRGMLTYYGIISFNRLYIYFCKCSNEPVDDDLLHLFLSVRINLLSFGSFVLETQSSTEYYQNYEASHPEQIIECCMNDKSLEYCLPKYETLLFLGNNNGLGDWEGMSEIAAILMDDFEVEYYRTIVIIKSIVLMIQNGESFDEITKQLFILSPELREKEKDIRAHLIKLYESVPVYNLKGWTRQEVRKVHSPSPVFTVIKGGKKRKIISRNPE